MTERPPHSPCRRTDRHDAHDFEVYARPFWCPGYTPAPKPSVGQATLHVAEAALNAVETALEDTLLPDAREKALAGIAAVLPAPVDQAAVLRQAISRLATRANQAPAPRARLHSFHDVAGVLTDELRRMVDEKRAAETRPEPCMHCGQPIRRVTGTLSAWWVHDPGGNTVCDWARAAASPRAAPSSGTHACSSCEGVDPDTCLNNPHRPPEQCPRSEGDGYGLQCQKPAGHNLCTFEEQPAAGARQDGADRPGLRERHRAAWAALTPEQQATRLAELDQDDERQDGAQPS